MPSVLWLLVPDEPPPDLERRLVAWLRLLRLVSKQAAFPTEPYGIGSVPDDVDAASLKVTLPSKFAGGTLFGKYKVDTAIDAALIAKAHELESPESVPLYHELMLDAIHAYENQRFREAILFSAIAVESLAKHELTQAHQAAVDAATAAAHLNVITFNLAGGQVSKKDPIFVALTEGDNFTKLIHEAPLYMWRRSLLNEQPALYQRAKELYGTRNRLSHGQAITEDQAHLLSIDSAGGLAATETAIEVFNWFGQYGHKPPRPEEVKLNTS